MKRKVDIGPTMRAGDKVEGEQGQEHQRSLQNILPWRRWEEKISKEEVRENMKRMKNGKAVGPDDIPV